MKTSRDGQAERGAGIGRRRSAAAVVLLLLFGAVRVPLEGGVADGFRAGGLHRGEVDIAMREKLGQAGFAAVLGGFRSLVASLVSLRATTAWENNEWGEVEALYGVVTRLQPRVEHYWEFGHWHLAYNAASYYEFEAEELSPLVRDQLFKGYVDRGQAMLEEGIENNPGSHRLPAQLGLLLQKRVRPPDHCGAATAYEAAVRNGATSMHRRFHAYELARCEGKEKEAYALLKALFLEAERHRKPTLLKLLGELEKRLQIPRSERLIPEG